MGNDSIRLWCVVSGFVCFAIFHSSNANGQLLINCPRSLADNILEVNNVRARIVNTGGLFYRGEPALYEVPKGSGSNAVFAGALWMAGLMDGQLRASASRYGNHELWAGPLDDQGNRLHDCLDFDRIYKINRTDLVNYQQTGHATQDMIDWPTGLGAPTVKATGDVVDVSGLSYSDRIQRVLDLENGERPLIRGDQMLWWIMNDAGDTHNSTDTPAIRIEVQAEAYGVARAFGHGAHTTLYTIRVRNKNSVRWTDSYVGVYLDSDLGDFTDDLVGTDSTLGMAYTYNYDNFDGGSDGYGTPPPALGVLFLEGPVADADLIDNDADGTVDEQHERLPTTTAGTHWPGPGSFGDPTTGIHYYRYMQGYWPNGQPFSVGGLGIDFAGIPTHWLFPGDPVSESFLTQLNLDGLGTDLGHRTNRMMFIASGPFNLEPNEETDFTFAIVWSIGKNHLNSVTELKQDAERIRKAFSGGAFDYRLDLSHAPITPPQTVGATAAIDENFPNPFSEQTTIRYRLSEHAYVRLSVFDLLGREVQRLVDMPQIPGIHHVEFDGSTSPSGVYFYKIHIGRAYAAMKMILQK